MSEPFLGEVRMFAGNFAPLGWTLCDGKLLAISENDALFALLGTTYGGNGVTNFAVPDLRGRVPIHVGSGISQGQVAGVESVTLLQTQIAGHTHPMVASLDVPTLETPANNVTGQAAARIYRAGAPTVSLAGSAMNIAGGSQPHDNMQPYLTLNFIIATTGIFPQQG
jgi:microcystin-dependent protein